MKTISMSQGSNEWHSFRKSRIGASDASAILNVSPWCSAMKLWERKVGIEPEQSENHAMSRGKALEHEARCAFMELTHITMAPEVVQHDQHEFMIASLDGLSVCERHALEIKVPGREDHLLALQGIVPKKYVPQLQHQLAVTGLDMIYYYSYDGIDNACIEVKRDQEYIDMLIQEELKFYECVVTCTPPELSERDYNIRYDKEWDYATRNWKTCKQHLDFAQKMEKEAREELIQASQSKNSKGFGVKVQKIMRQGSVRFSDIELLKSLNLDEYRNPPSETWRISIDE